MSKSPSPEPSSKIDNVDKKEYITSQIIKYMGNKRKLLPIIESTLDEIRTAEYKPVKENLYVIKTK